MREGGLGIWGARHASSPVWLTRLDSRLLYVIAGAMTVAVGSALWRLSCHHPNPQTHKSTRFSTTTTVEEFPGNDDTE